MTTLTLAQQIAEEAAKLPLADQQRVLAFAQALSLSHSRGTPGKDLLKFVGSIDKEDLEAMKQAIEEECERIEPDEW
jgi:hypothetical protein